MDIEVRLESDVIRFCTTSEVVIADRHLALKVTAWRRMFNWAQTPQLRDLSNRYKAPCDVQSSVCDHFWVNKGRILRGLRLLLRAYYSSSNACTVQEVVIAYTPRTTWLKFPGPAYFRLQLFERGSNHLVRRVFACCDEFYVGTWCCSTIGFIETSLFAFVRTGMSRVYCIFQFQSLFPK